MKPDYLWNLPLLIIHLTQFIQCFNLENIMENITLQFTIEEVNMLLASLGNQPYVQVFGLVQKIQQQAAPQLQAQPNGQAVPQHIAEN
jgi:hypothetical protein